MWCCLLRVTITQIMSSQLYFWIVVTSWWFSHAIFTVIISDKHKHTRRNHIVCGLLKVYKRLKKKKCSQRLSCYSFCCLVITISRWADMYSNMWLSANVNTRQIFPLFAFPSLCLIHYSSCFFVTCSVNDFAKYIIIAVYYAESMEWIVLDVSSKFPVILHVNYK